ncbi:MAG: aldehyde dehydrogenase family protein [Bradyrhizobium sp.]
MSVQTKTPLRTKGAMIQVSNFVAGKWESGEEKELRRLNPADQEDSVAISPDSGAATAKRAIEGVTHGAAEWRRMTPPERGKIVLRAAQIVESDRHNIAQLITREQGKPITESYAEVKRAIDIMEYVSGMGRRLGGQTLPSELADVFCYTMRQPIGSVALISPWNIPFAIPCWKIAPAFVCGCPIVFKPSPFTPATAARVVEVFLEAGMPREAIALVHGGVDVGEQLVGNPMVAGISFTGSTKVGMGIHAAAARRLAKTQLEMGGKNPQVILADAELDLAVDSCVVSALDVSGQRCTCVSRVVVEDAVAEEFTERLVDRFRNIRIGAGIDPNVNMGPLIDSTRLRDVDAFVTRAKAEGGRVLTGGKRPEGLEHGHFYSPTVIDGITPRHEIAREEVFGPVLAIMRAGNFDEAMSIANGVEYGLTSSIFTKDLSRAFNFIEKIEAGMIHVNRPTLGGFSHFPFGGHKHSSHGPREVGDDTIGFYTNLKSAYIRYN